jgi:hypothetical protein
MPHNELLRPVIHDPETLAEYDRLEARRKELAKVLPWTDDAFNEMIAINRRLVELAATAKQTEEAA